MWINFESIEPFAIKVIAGGVNAISGESMIEDSATTIRRKAKLSHGQSIRDYIVCGARHAGLGNKTQEWLDGISTADGKVMQFVATTTNSGYSVETQVTGKDSVAGISFEVIPKKGKGISIKVHDLRGRTRVFKVSIYVSVATLKTSLFKVYDIPPSKQRLIFNGYQLFDGEFERQCHLFQFANSSTRCNAGILSY